MTKVSACKGASQNWARKSHFMLLGVQESGREWTSTLPNELPLWELESRWTPKFTKSNCRGQNPLDWDIYIIGKLKLTIWLLTTKSLESPRFPYIQVACNTSLENSDQRLQFCFKPHLNRRFVDKVMAPPSYGSPNFGNFGTPTWESWNKMPFECRSRHHAQNIL